MNIFTLDLTEIGDREVWAGRKKLSWQGKA